MRHFIGYRADGTLASLETFGPGGWPSLCPDCGEGCGVLANPECQMEAAASLRGSRASRNPDIVGFIAYDCPCPSTESVCNPGHYNDQFAQNYVDTVAKTFVPKPVSVMKIDGADVANEEVFSLAPGTSCQFKLTGPDVPDGAVVDVWTRGPIDITDGPDHLQLTFAAGETPTTTLVTPGQGMKGVLSITGKYIRPQRLYLRGFAS